MVPRKPKPEVGALARRAPEYDSVLAELVHLIEGARHAAARSVNAVMTATYWLIGRRMVEHEQHGVRRAAYGEEVLKQLSLDLSQRFGRGFSVDRLELMRLFYTTYQETNISATASRKLLPETSATPSRKSELEVVTERFPLPWSHYVMLLRRCRSPEARQFYETEALRGGWTVRQLERQINSQFYERIALSRNKAGMLAKGGVRRPEDVVVPEEEIKSPYVLEFLNLKDEYSESELEEALILKLESFLLELGGDFTFVGRQRRLRVGEQWFRVDLLFFHRRLRCLVIIDLKLGEFTHADAGQMHLYLNYAREHWVLEGENPPVGLILCAQKDGAVAKYALEGLPNKVLAAEYRTALPEERVLVEEIERTRRQIETRSRTAVPRKD